MSSRSIFGFAATVATMVWLGVVAYFIVADVQLNRDITGHLKRAADANGVELALKELGVAIDAARLRGDTAGYTSIMYRTPDEDVGFWFSNLIESQRQLLTIPNAASMLEKSNALMKLRETLLDHTSSGDGVTYPCGLARYPMNGSTVFWMLFSLGVSVVCWAVFLAME